MNSVKYAINWNGKRFSCSNDELLNFIESIDNDGLLRQWIRKFNLLIEFEKIDNVFKLKDIYSKGKKYSDNNKRIIAKEIGMEVI